MKENKTKPTDASVNGYVSSIADDERRADCETLVRLMSRATKEKPKMWGTAIVGFGSYHYRYESGREGDACLTGFSSRRGDISIYVVASFPGMDGLLAKLGKFKRGKGCLYVRRLADVDSDVLERIVAGAAAERKRLHG